MKAAFRSLLAACAMVASRRVGNMREGMLECRDSVRSRSVWYRRFRME